MRFRSVALTVLAITALRLAYNSWVSPYELVADEAQYWDWSRHLDWSYYSKGPGIAWLIALATHVLGDAEWAIRAPAAMSFAVVMFALAFLAHELIDTPARPRAALLMPVIVLLIPAYQLSALLMTIDPPYLACWAVALCVAWRAWKREREGAPSLSLWILLGAAVGVGVLFKYTAVLFVPSVLIFVWLDRRSARRSDWWKRAMWSGVTVIAVTAPLWIWNLRHDAVALDHLFGYLRLPGGDRPAAASHSPLFEAIAYPFVQLAVVGPVLLLAVVGGRSLKREPDGRGSRAVLFALCMAVPTLAVFGLAVSRTRIEANWPMAAFLSLLPLSALAAANRSHRWWWRAAMAYGLMALVGIHAPLLVARVPVVGSLVPVHRFSGSRARVVPLAGCVHDFVVRNQGRGVIVAPGHNEAGLLAYYLPGHPTVASAGSLYGNRLSAYDFFPETDLRSAALRGRPWLLVGSTAGPCLERPAVNPRTTA